MKRGTDDVRLQREPVLVAAHDLEDRLDSDQAEADRDRDVRGMRVACRVVGRVDRIHPLRHLLDLLPQRLQVAAVDAPRLARDDRRVAFVDQRPERGHGVPSGARPSGSQPPGRWRSLPLTRFAHDDVPTRPIVDRRPQFEVSARARPGKQGEGARPRLGLEPHAPHLRLDLAVTVLAHASARSVPKGLRARHRARHAGVVQHALTTHAASEDRLLDGVLDRGDDAHRDQAGVSARRCSSSSFARFVAAAASGA